MEFHAKTVEDMAEQSKNHGMEMFQKGDKAHVAVMEKMREKMKDPQAAQKWMEQKKKEFDSLPDVPS